MSYFKTCSNCGSQCDLEAVLCVSCGSFFDDKAAKKVQQRRESSEDALRKAVLRQKIKNSVIAVLVLAIMSYGIYRYFVPSSIQTYAKVKDNIVSELTLVKDFYNSLSASPYWSDAKSYFKDEQLTCDLSLSTGYKDITLEVKLNLDSIPLYYNKINQRLNKEDIIDTGEDEKTVLYGLLKNKALKDAAMDIGKQLELIHLFKFSSENMLNFKFLQGLVQYKNIAAAHYAPDWGRRYVWDEINNTEKKSLSEEYLTQWMKVGMDEKNELEMMKYLQKRTSYQLIKQILAKGDTESFLNQATLIIPRLLQHHFKENAGLEKYIDLHYSNKDIKKTPEEINALSADARKKYDEDIKNLYEFKKELLVPHYINKGTKSLNVFFDRLKPGTDSFTAKWISEDLFEIAKMTFDETSRQELFKKIFASFEALNNNDLKNELTFEYLKKYDIKDLPLIDCIKSALSVEIPSITMKNLVLIDGPDVKGIGLLYGSEIITKKTNMQTAAKPHLTVFDNEGNQELISDYEWTKQVVNSSLAVLSFKSQKIKVDKTPQAQFLNTQKGLCWRVHRSLDDNKVKLTPDFMKFKDTKHGGQFYISDLERGSDSNLIPNQSIILNKDLTVAAFSLYSGFPVANNLLSRSIKDFNPRKSTGFIGKTTEENTLAKNNFFEISEMYRLVYFNTSDDKILQKLIAFYKSQNKQDLVEAYEKLLLSQ